VSRWIGAALLAPILGGCTNLASFSVGELPVAPGSPVALAVEEAVRNPGPIPSFASVPPIPSNPPTAQSQAADAGYVESRVAELNRAIASMPPIGEREVESYAARARAELAGVEPPTDAERAEIEAFARAARARATPPPAPR
jgi:hypothetical protein